MKKLRHRLFATIVPAFVFLVTASLFAGADSFYIKEGDRVVFYGDSITDQRHYTSFVETFIVTRFPTMNVTFTHSGWGGDRVSGGGGGNIETRLDRDVFAYKPTVMTVMLGMNDGEYRAYNQATGDVFAKGLETIVTKVQSTLPGIRMTLIQTSPFDDITRAPRFPGGYNEVLLRYGACVQEIAQKNHQLYADLNTPVVATLKKAMGTNAELAAQIIGDRVHPSQAGHLVMAGALLKAWQAPAIVTDVEIDAASARATRSANTRITGLSSNGVVSWRQLDAALPMPIDMKVPLMEITVASCDFVETLNQQPLKVTGLKDEYYFLKIDDKNVGTFTREELAKGINLAMLDTPMRTQAAAVHALTLRRTAAHNARWRSVQVPYANAESEELRQELPAAIAAFDAETRTLAAKQRAAAQPVEHLYELAPQKTRGTVAVFGDSLTFGGELGNNKPRVWVRQAEEKAAGRLTVINEGKGGRQTNSVKQFDEMIARNPRLDAIAIMLGTNDSRDTSSQCVPKAVANLTEMIEHARQAYGDKIGILLIGPPNIRKDALVASQPIANERDENLRALGNAYRELAAKMGVHFASAYGVVPADSLVKDGVHPDVQGHEALAKALLPSLRDVALSQ